MEGAVWLGAEYEEAGEVLGVDIGKADEDKGVSGGVVIDEGYGNKEIAGPKNEEESLGAWAASVGANFGSANGNEDSPNLTWHEIKTPPVVDQDTDTLRD